LCSIALMATPALCIRSGREVIVFCSNSLRLVSIQCEFAAFKSGILTGHVAFPWPTDIPKGKLLLPQLRDQLTGLLAHPNFGNGSFPVPLPEGQSERDPVSIRDLRNSLFGSVPKPSLKTW